jgi:hypothetical protein
MVVRTVRWKTVMGPFREYIFEVLAPVWDYDFLGDYVVDVFRRLGEALTRRHRILRGVSLSM